MTSADSSATLLAKQVAPGRVKDVARWGLRRYGSLTARRRPLPDYLIIGAKRGGSTSLWRNLRRHPQVMSMFPAAENLKSPHFFDIHWSKGPRWYRSYFPTDSARREREAEAGGPSAVGDASPYYLFHPRAADRAASVVPDAKIVVALRHPVDRAWSHYRERRKEGTEPLGFAEAIAAEDARLAEAAAQMAADPDRYCPTHDFCSYLARGRYAEQLQPWLERFGRDQILVVRSETYYAEPDRILRQVVEFLGLDPDLEPVGVSRHMNRLPTASMEPSQRSRLNAYFRPYVDELETTLDRDFAWDLDD